MPANVCATDGDLDLHSLIALEGFELFATEDAQFCKSVCQVLAKLYIPHENGLISELRIMASDLANSKIDIVSSRALEKFIERLDALDTKVITDVDQ